MKQCLTVESRKIIEKMRWITVHLGPMCTTQAQPTPAPSPISVHKGVLDEQHSSIARMAACRASPLPRSLFSPCETATAVAMAATTMLPASREDAQKDHHGPLRPSRGPNPPGQARTLAIATIFILYVFILRRRFPPLRPTPTSPTTPSALW